MRSCLHSLAIIALLSAFVSAIPGLEVGKGAVSIDAKFPGGNVHVTANEEGVVQFAPDLRGDNPWFYWCFEATATRPGRVAFVTPEKVAGFKNGGIGFQGPAISEDRGKTWRWMGTDSVRDNTFHYDFAKKGESIRFAVTIPYVQSNLDRFLKEHAANKHLDSSILTKSRKGRPVDLLQVGEAGRAKKAMLVTGRHHAAETIASYVLEGFLAAAMSDDPAGIAFRKNYLLFAVPIVDRDGVEEGDQGKNRKPHDHNRDYGTESIYPEIQAIRDLDRKHDFKLTLDFHCPTLVMEDHQVLHFVGPRNHPEQNFANVSELAKGIKSRLPKSAPVGPLVWLKPADKPTPMNSHYFGFKPSTILAATLEVPFAPKGRAMDVESCRSYGKLVLEAFVATRFVPPDAKP